MAGPPRMSDLSPWMQNAGIRLSSDSERLVNRMFDMMNAEDKPAAAKQYSKTLARFLAFAEANGHALNSLPPTLPDEWVNVEFADVAPSTRDAQRGLLATAFNRATADLGMDFSHMQVGSREVTKVPSYIRQKERAAKDLLFRAQAGRRMVEDGFIPPPSTPVIQGGTPPTLPVGGSLNADRTRPAAASMIAQDAPLPAGPPAVIDAPPPSTTPEFEATPPPSAPAAEVEEPVSDNANPQVIVVQQPPAPRRNPSPPNAVVLPTAGQQPLANSQAIQLVVNGVAFREPFIGIYRIMDGMLPGTQAGQEVLIETPMSRAIAQYGTPDAYIQRATLPKMKNHITPGTAVVSFALIGLNAAKQPTNTRAEVTVAVTDQSAMMAGTGTDGAPQQFIQSGVAMPQYMMPSQMQQMPMSPEKEMYLRNLEKQMDEARAREEKAREESKKASDTAMQMMLMNQAQQAQDSRRELEDLKRQFLEREERRREFASTPFMPPPLPLPAQEPQTNIADVLRANAEQTAAMLNALRPEPPPPPVKDDTTEKVVMPLFQMMAQQSAENARMIAAQQAESQKLMLAMQQESQRRSDESTKMMMSMQSENTKMLMGILTAKPAESDFDKAMKTIMINRMGDMLQGGGGGSSGVVTDIVNNLPGILGGFAKIQQANAITAQAQRPAAPRPQQTAQSLPATPAAASAASAAPAASTGEQTTLPGMGSTATPGDVMANPAMQVPDALRQSAVAMIAAAKDENDAGDMGFIAALQNYIPELAKFNEQFASTLLEEFKNAGGYEDLYAVAKFALRFGGLVDNRENIVAVTDALHRQYSVVYPALTGGQNKTLPDANIWDEDGDEDEDDTTEEAA